MASEADCVFCRIVAGELPSTRVYEDDELLVIPDIAPAAPLHLLVIAKTHIPTVNDLDAESLPLVGKMFDVARRLAADAGVAEEGYRLTVNVNEGGGQTVLHLHLHILGGRQMERLG